MDAGELAGRRRMPAQWWSPCPPRTPGAVVTSAPVNTPAEPPHLVLAAFTGEQVYVWYLRRRHRGLPGTRVVSGFQWTVAPGEVGAMWDRFTIRRLSTCSPVERWQAALMFDRRVE